MAKLYWRLKVNGKWNWIAVDSSIAQLWMSITNYYGPGKAVEIIGEEE